MNIEHHCPSEARVSVLMITYNHEPYIAQAIESVLMQQTDFEYELVIGEDCSTDRTREIVVEYAEKHPDRIRPLLHEQNLGLMGKNNLVATYRACQGKYIAALEGDDYWTDEHKLQKQVDFMESHPECTICAHNTMIIDREGGLIHRTFLPKALKRTIRTRQAIIFGIRELIQYHFFHTSSCLFRKSALSIIPEFVNKLPGPDFGLFFLLASSGKIGYINEVMSVYRQNSNGIWNCLAWEGRISHLTKEYRILYENTDPKYQPMIVDAICRESVETYLDEMYPKGLSLPELNKGARECFNTIAGTTNLLQLDLDILNRKFCSKFYASLGYRLYNDNKLSAARKSLLKASFYDRSWIRNRGFWSIIFKSLLYD